MVARWFWFAVFVAAAGARELSDEEYYSMPRLFHLDSYAECSARRGLFCLGSFRLLPGSNHQLITAIQEFSSDKYHFNHSHIHRGYCVTSRCGHAAGGPPRDRFRTCVDNITRSQYGLETKLTSLEYCRRALSTSRPLDSLDLTFISCLAVILLANVAGTAYDSMRNQENKPNKYLSSWSLRTSWSRLTTDHVGGDPRLAALAPLQGMKALTLLLVMLAHTVLAQYTTYIYNPSFFEKASHHPLSAFFQNGTSIVQTFIMISNFLLAYNLLLFADKPGKKLSLKMLPSCIVHRLVRILPTYLVVVGGAATLWQRLSDGPLWGVLVGGECQRCREKWWSQLLFINNLVQPDLKCLIHTWFLAVDMQLYVVCAALTLCLCGAAVSARRALALLAGLLLCAVLGNFLAATYLGLQPMVTLMFPEYMRRQFFGERSFTWLYQAPWDSLPAALLGTAAAFLLHLLQKEQLDLRQYLTFRVLYRMSVPGMFLWVFAGYFLKGAGAGVGGAGVALYAAADRPVFVTIVVVAMMGFIHKVDDLWWQFLSWRGWSVLGRMSLSVYLIHWLVSLTQLAVRDHLSPVSVHLIAGQYLWTVFLSYWCALVLHLFVELPAQKFLQTVIT